MQQEEVLEQVRNICVRYGAAELILFGSRAAGTVHERSDYDLAVSGVKNPGHLTEDINEIPTLCSFDVVNLDTCGNEALKREIRQYGRKIL